MSDQFTDLAAFEAQATEVAAILRELGNERRTDDPLQAGRMGRGERLRAGRGRRIEPVGTVPASGEDAGREARNLPARVASALVPDRRSAHRAASVDAANPFLSATEASRASLTA